MNLVFLLEEESAKALLQSLIPRYLRSLNIEPDSIQCRYIAFQGKSDLRSQLMRKLRGWNQEQSCFIILQDQDSQDCREAKRDLVNRCQESGKAPDCVVRIACTELESWYFGELGAVENALCLNGKLVRYSRRSSLRIPDSIVNPSKKLAEITDNQYQKVGASREIGKHLSTSSEQMNTSVSYQSFLQGVHKALEHLGAIKRA